MPVDLEPILDKTRVEIKLLLNAIPEAAKRELDAIEKTLAPGYRGWKTKDKPKWRKRVSKNTKKISGGGDYPPNTLAVIETNSRPYIWVIGGTKRRYRRMSKNFRPKTRPGSISSGGGSGWAEGWYKTPVKGIEAREHHKIAERIHAPLLRRRMTREFVKASKRVFQDGPQDTR